MKPVLEIIPHPAGPWLVRAGCVQYSVPARVGEALSPLAGRRPGPEEIRTCLRGVSPSEAIDSWISHLDQSLKGCAPKRFTRVIRFKIPLIPAALVRSLAHGLGPWTDNRQLGILALIGGAGYLGVWAGPGPAGFSSGLPSVILGLGLFLLSAFWHELGHATALARSGYPPGGIGAGLLFVIPVLYADVTAVGILPRNGRLRVDAAGVVFQLAGGGLMMVLARLPGCPSSLAAALFLAGSTALLAVVWSLFPFIRSDGFWLLCDLLRLDDLECPPRRQVSRALRIFLVAYQLANALFLLLVGLWFPWRMIRLVLGFIPRTGIFLEPVAVNWLTTALIFIFAGVMGIGLAQRMGTLVGAALLGLRGLLFPR